MAGGTLDNLMFLGSVEVMFPLFCTYLNSTIEIKIEGAFVVIPTNTEHFHI